MTFIIKFLCGMNYLNGERTTFYLILSGWIGDKDQPFVFGLLNGIYNGQLVEGVVCDELIQV